MKRKKMLRWKVRAAALWAVVILAEMAVAAFSTAAVAAFLLSMGFKATGEAAFGVEWLIITLLFCASYTAIHYWLCNKIFGEG